MTLCGPFCDLQPPYCNALDLHNRKMSASRGHTAVTYLAAFQASCMGPKKVMIGMLVEMLTILQGPGAFNCAMLCCLAWH